MYIDIYIYIYIFGFMLESLLRAGNAASLDSLGLRTLELVEFSILAVLS